MSALKKVNPKLNIDVITTQPNRYKTYKVKALDFERDAKVSITRIALPQHESGMFDQSLAFFKEPRCDDLGHGLLNLGLNFHKKLKYFYLRIHKQSN